ncbi:MAG TPA: protein kinase [Syntrophomonadaceae bacterium]|nr:protein kinase [Syntrophomonadaceae bacterium]
MREKGERNVCPNCAWQDGAVPESPLYLTPGTVLDERYIVGRVLGHGGFAITYLGWDNDLNTRVAIKEYMPFGIATRSTGEANVSAVRTGETQEHFHFGLEKFLEEAKTLARFDEHPGIVSVRDVFKANQTAYLVMQYLEGATLKEYLTQQGGKISYQNALEIIMPVLDAIREVHSMGILHRDISPDNIFITKSGQVKLLDFGAARYALVEHSRSFSVIVKAGYAPEEQYRSRGKQGEYTDVYAVAATLYRAITGQVPVEALDRTAEDILEAPGQMGVEMPPLAETALMKALSVYSADRHQSIKEFQDALLNDREVQKSTTPPDDRVASPAAKPQERINRVRNGKEKPSLNIRNRFKTPKKWAVLMAVLVLILVGWVAHTKMGSKASPSKSNGIQVAQIIGSSPTITDSNTPVQASNQSQNGQNSTTGAPSPGDTQGKNEDIANPIDGNATTAPAKDNKEETTPSNTTGTLTLPNGSKYVGEIRDGQANGQGSCTGSSGSITYKYVGNFKSNKYNGQGTFTGSSGYKYSGGWKDGLSEGYGIEEFSWEKYEGEFRGGLRNGQGTLYKSDGTVKTGQWKDGTYIG